MRGLEPRGKNHSTVRGCPKVENGVEPVPSGTTASANGDGCLGKVKDLPADILPHRDPYMEAIGAGFTPLPDDPEL